MNAADNPGKHEKQLPDLDTLDAQSLKALVLAKQAEIDSHTTEIENLKLLILKLKRMHFGPRSRRSTIATLPGELELRFGRFSRPTRPLRNRRLWRRLVPC